MTPSEKLRAIKIIHTLIWAFFAACIVAVPVCVANREIHAAWWLIAIVLVEVAVIVTNRMRCPLTLVASRYTNDRQDNFDIYLPLWLARHNKTIFGCLFAAGLVYTLLVSLGGLSGAPY